MKNNFKWLVSLNPIYLLILAILLKAVQIILAEGVTWCDLQDQLVGTQSLIAGHGVTIPFATATDLSQINWKPVVQWPSGYNYVLAPFLALVPDVVWAVVLLNLTALACFIYGSMLVWKTLAPKVNPVWLNVLLLVFAFNLSPLIYLFSSDWVFFALLWLLLGLCLQQFWSSSNLKTLLLAILAFLVAFGRTAYIPCSFGLLALCAIYAWYIGSRSLTMQFIVALGLATGMWGVTVITAPPKVYGVSDAFSFGTTISRAQVPDPDQPFQPENLKAFRIQDTHKGLLDDRVFNTFLKYTHLISGNQLSTTTKLITQLVGLVTLITLLYLLFKRLKREGFLPDQNAVPDAKLAVYLLVYVLVMSLAVVAWASFTRPALKEGTEIFTFLKSERYYIVLMVAVPFLFIYAIGQNALTGLLRYKLIGVLIINLMYWPVAFSGLIKSAPGGLALGESKLENLAPIKAAINRLKASHPGVPVVYYASHPFYNKQLAIAGTIMLHHTADLRQVNSSKPVILLLSADQGYEASGSYQQVQQFLTSHAATSVYKADRFELFAIDLK